MDYVESIFLHSLVRTSKFRMCEALLEVLGIFDDFWAWTSSCKTCELAKTSQFLQDACKTIQNLNACRVPICKLRSRKVADSFLSVLAALSRSLSLSPLSLCLSLLSLSSLSPLSPSLCLSLSLSLSVLSLSFSSLPLPLFSLSLSLSDYLLSLSLSLPVSQYPAAVMVLMRL